MLAFMPQPSPIPDPHSPYSMGTGTMSVALLPSSRMSCSQQTVPTLLPPGPSPSKRPKLSLNTSSLASAFGKASTSLRLETLSATSPTSRNTFKNAQSAQRTSSAKSRKSTLMPIVTDAPSTPTQRSTSPDVEVPDPPDTTDVSTSPAVSATSASTIDSLPSEVPYKLPFNASSILTNGPIPRLQSRRMSFAQSRPMFPAPKKVAFRAQLTEDIKTTKYTMRHSDIEASSLAIPTVVAHSKEDENEEVEEATNAERDATSRASVETAQKHKSPEEEDDSDSVPATPIAGRSKRHRQWVWTLGPVNSAAGNDESEEADTEATNPDQ